MDFALNKLKSVLCRITILPKLIGIFSLTVARLSLLGFPLETLKSTTECYTEMNQQQNAIEL